MTRADFSELVQKLSRKLYGYAFRILQNQEESEDAVQEIFIKLWNMGEKLEEYASIDALAATMTRNYCIDQFRKKKNINSEDCNVQEYTHITSPSPYDQMEQLESYDIIHEIIDNLPDIYKIIIKLREIDGLSYDEIAEKTNQNINTLRVTLSRARRIIREEYKKHHYERKGIELTSGKVL
jgi:RNA polymerase sigma factor (sigma-70 family)